MKRIILTTADGCYIDVLASFLASMRYNKNDYFIRLDFINGTRDMENYLRRIYPGLEINSIALDGYEKLSPADRLLNLIWTRPRQLWKALNEDWDQVMKMDCDMLIRGSIEHIWDDLMPSVLKVFMKKERKKRPNTYFQGGVQLYGNSPDIKRYYQEFIDLVKPPFAFYDGQRALYELWLKHKHTVKLVKLDRTYNDDRYKGFSSKSLVWHVKHGQITTEPWLSEFKKYLNEANKYYDN